MKQIITKIFITVLFLNSQQAVAQVCECNKNFDWIKKTFEQNDAGFGDAIKRKGTTAYRQHNQKFAAQAKKINDKFLCAGMLNEWLHFFQEGAFVCYRHW